MDGLATRHMLRRDYPRVLEIERLSFSYPWTRQEFRDMIRPRAATAVVAEAPGVGVHEGEEVVVGFLIYERLQDCYRLLNLAVHPDYRRLGVGRFLVGMIQAKADKGRLGRRRVEEHVSEYNLGAQKFFRALGFRAVRVDRAIYCNGGDAYVMVYGEPEVANV